MSTINILHNGDALKLEKPLSISDFLESHGYTGKLVAVAINGQFIPRSNHQGQAIQDGDKVEIVAPMQGG